LQERHPLYNSFEFEFSSNEANAEESIMKLGLPYEEGARNKEELNCYPLFDIDDGKDGDHDQSSPCNQERLTQ
jgi:hypothetical protein